MLYPSDPLKLIWDVIISFALLMACIMTPMVIAFEDIEHSHIFLIMIDFVFGIDMILNFNTAIEDEEFKIISSRKQISSIYLKGWFFVDIISITPFKIILHAIKPDGPINGSHISVNSFLRVTKMGLIYKLIKLSRLLRVLKFV